MNNPYFKKKSVKCLALCQANFTLSENQGIHYFLYKTSQMSWQRHGYTCFCIAFVMLKSYLRQRLEIDDFKKISSS